MLQVARLAPKILGESAELVRNFLVGQRNADGGFRDRAGRSDLYYTVFGLEGLMALQAEIPLEQTEAYLAGFGTGEQLDMVHLCCLARCRVTVAQMRRTLIARDWAEAVAANLAAFRAADGGFNPGRAAKFSTVYAGFLAVAAYQDLRVEVPSPDRLVEAIQAMRTTDGAWANERAARAGATNATAAAVTLLRNLSVPVDSAVGDWLLARHHVQGGFLAAPGAPIPDLLSTATALHALSGLQRSIAGVKESCLDFIDTLWTNEGAFHGHWDEQHLDVEYAYYGLLALGHLSL